MNISLNGELVKAESYRISPTGEGLSFGYGLFETIKMMDGKILFMDQHLERLQRGCKELKIPLHYDKMVIKDYTHQFARVNHIISGVVKIMYIKNKDQYDLLISSRENPYTQEKYKKGFKLCFAEEKKNPHGKLTYIKSNNYLENILAKEEAKKNNCDEAIFLNVDNRVSEGSYTNIFFVKQGIIYTPSIKCGLLPGILRGQVIDLIHGVNLKCQMGEYAKEDLMDADEIFLTNSIMDIMPVFQLEEKRLDICRYDITRLLQREFFDRHYK